MNDGYRLKEKMYSFIQDLRFGFRLLLKHTGFTIVALIALGLGIGATTAIFTVVNSVLIQPLPYTDSSRLMTIWENHQGRGGPAVEYTSPTGFADWRDQTKSFSHVAAFANWAPTLSGRGGAEQIQGAVISHNMFSLLDIKPLLGQTFRPEDDKPGAANVVIISHSLWQQRFNSDNSIIGKPVTLNGEAYTIIGVMPAGFNFPILNMAEVWRTIQPGLPEGCLRGCVILRVLARLRPGVPVESARTELTALAGRLEREFPETNSKVGVTLLSLHEFLVGDVKTPILLIFGAVFMVLLIACANVANLMLARSSTRSREIAVRAALGAGRGRILRQLLVEGLTISLIGGILGAIVSIWLVELLISFSPANLPRMSEITIQWPVFVFTAGLAILTGVLAGLAPMAQLSRFDFNETLKDGGKGIQTGKGSRRALNLFVVVEIALSLTLLIVAGLLMKSFIILKTADPGFNPNGVLTMNLSLPNARYPENDRVREMSGRIIGSLESIPGVESVGAVSSLPLGAGNTDASFLIEGRPAPAPNREPVAWYSLVSVNYFSTMKIRLLHGRLFEAGDDQRAKRVLVINEMLAKRYFPNENPIGKRIGNGRPDGWREIIGVTADVKHFGLNQEPRPSMFFTIQQIPSRRLNIVLRTHTDPLSLVPAVRREIAGLDSDLALSNIDTMENLAAESLSIQRLYLVLIGIFAFLAVVLAAAGIYGVMSYAVSQRTQEIGIRMALGAQTRSIMNLVVGQAMLIAVIGIAIGLTLTLLVSNTISSQLYGVSEMDLMTYIGVSILLLIISLIACIIPARRAASVDPLVTLRYE